MSGVKERTVVVTERELNNLRRRAAQATDLTQKYQLLVELQEKSERFRKQQEQRMNQINTQIANMGTKVDTAMAAASREVQALRESLQRSIQATNATLQDFMTTHQADMQNMQESFSNELSQVRIDTANMINANNRRIEAVMNENNNRIYADMNTMRSELTANINEVRGQVNNLEAQVARHAKDEAVLLEMAREYFAQASSLADQIQANFRVELLCPGRLETLLHARDNASREIDTAEKMPANASVARLESRNVMEAALQLYQDVVMAEQEWNMRYQAAQQAVLAAEAQLEASREMDLSDEQGPAIVDVEHWSNGELSTLEERLTGLRVILDKPDTVSMEMLDDIKDAGLQISSDIDTTASFAGIAFFASQDRADIAQDIADSMLERLGLQIVDHSYEGNDMRGAHRVHLRNQLTGFEMVVSQSPSATAEGSIANHLESDIISFGALSTEEGLKAEEEMRRALCALTQLGFADTPVQTAAGYETGASDRVERANITEFRRVKKPAIPKPAMGQSAQAVK